MQHDYVMISVAARLAGVHVQTLRLYEQRGLIRPERSPGGTRLYSTRDIQRLARIQELSGQGINLLGAQRILELEERIRSLEADLARSRREQARTEHRLRRAQPGQLATRQKQRAEEPSAGSR